MRKIFLSLTLLAGFASQAMAADNYTATAGSGLTFGAKDASGILYSRFIVCDNTTVSQCLAVDASGRLSIIPNTAINIAQINGVTVLMGNGATGTGSQRVTIANDNTIPTGWPTAANQSSQITQETAINTALGTTASTVCGTAAGTCDITALIKYLNTQASTPLDNSSVAINVSTATTTQLVALSGATLIRVTSFDVIAGGTGNITFVYGTGTNCGTGTTSLTGPYNLTAQAGISKGSGIGTILKVPSGNALCVTTSAAVQMSGSISYQQF